MQVKIRYWKEVQREMEFGEIRRKVLQNKDLDDYLENLTDTFGDHLLLEVNKDTFEYIGRWIVHVYECTTDAMIPDYPEAAEIEEFGRHQAVMYAMGGPY